MKSSRYFLPIVTALSIAVFSCKKDNPGKNNSTPTPDIYVIGAINGKPAYWKNGTAIQLSESYPGGNIGAGSATAIFISGDDIYISGDGITNHGHDTAVYWKNDSLNVLPSVDNTTVATVAKAIVVSGSDIYVGGSQYGVNHAAILWKNGVPATFGGNASEFGALAFPGSNIYASGPNENIGSSAQAVYYKNGQMMNLANNGVGSYGYEITLAGGDVYVAGVVDEADQSYHAVYWKNGVVNNFSSTPSAGITISVSGDDVYVGGQDLVNGHEVATVWKNGIPDHLVNNATGNSECNEVRVSGNDVYAVGVIYDESSNAVATLWKNGVASTLAPAPSYAYDIRLK